MIILDVGVIKCMYVYYILDDSKKTLRKALKAEVEMKKKLSSYQLSSHIDLILNYYSKF